MMLSMVQSKKTAAGYWNYADSFKYTSAGAVSSVRLGNGRFETTQFNSRLQPTQIGLGYSATDTGLLKLGFSYNTAGQNDNNGNVLSQTITAPTEVRNNVTYSGFTATQTYTYDSLNRIRDAGEMTGTTQQWKQTFDYDRYGNRRFDENSDGNGYLTTTFGTRNCTITAYNPTGICNKQAMNPTISAGNNRLVEDQDGDSVKEYEYDTAGNTKRDSAGKQFFYDAENKQTLVKNANDQTIGKYCYDGDGKRVKKEVPGTGETTIFIYDASGMLVAEYSTVTNNNPQVSYLTSDHLGSPRTNTDASGAVTARHDYQPFGEEIARASYGNDDVRKQFTSYERDNETGDDFAEARYYNSKLGRFNSVDPLMASADIESPQTFNRYVYVINNPLNFTDPTGMLAESNQQSDPCPPVCAAGTVGVVDVPLPTDPVVKPPVVNPPKIPGNTPIIETPYWLIWLGKKAAQGAKFSAKMSVRAGSAFLFILTNPTSVGNPHECRDANGNDICMPTLSTESSDENTDEQTPSGTKKKKDKKKKKKDEGVGKDAKKMSPDDIGEFLGKGKDWHKTSAKSNFLNKYKKGLKGSTNADFYVDKNTGEVLLKGNKSGAWVRTGKFL